MLHVADGRDASLSVVARGVREAERLNPIVACTRDRDAEPGSEAIHVAGSPADEIRALPMRFGAAVICPAAERVVVEDELDALDGKLLPGAFVLALELLADESDEFSRGQLELVERIGAAALLQESRTRARPRPAAQRLDQRQTHQRRRARLAQLERNRRRLSPATAPVALDVTPGALQILGTRLTESEAALAALSSELARMRGQASDAATGAPVTIVVPIHNAYAELVPCIDSVLAHTPEPHELLLLNDASTDERVAPRLDQYARASSRVTVLTNAENRGYTATINIGCAWAKGDVVLLNSDTEVPSGWLDGLQSVACSRRDVATVTPVSNAAGAFSVPTPNVDSELLDGVGVDDMAALVARLSPRMRPAAPTGNGFCMYIRREALDRVGPFDEENFPRGYGEENDFSQRAEAAGFVNLIDDATFVYHKRAASFGTHKPELIAAAKERLRVKHPEYKPAVQRFLADDPLRELRTALADALRRGADEVKRLPELRPTLLLVLHAGGGGVPATNHDLAGSLAASYRCLTLSCDLDEWVLTQTEGSADVELGRFEFGEPWRLRDGLNQERAEALNRLVSEQQVSLVHVRSLIGSGPELVGRLKALNVPVVCSLHDFFAVCPTVQLLDEHERYCAGHCTSGDGPCPTPHHWVGEQPDLKHRYVHRWREWVAEHLAQADAFVTSSVAARDVLVDHFGFMDDGRMRVIEHGRDAREFCSVSVPPGARPRVAVFGALGIAKGITLLRALLELDRRQGPAFEFHFLGALHGTFRPEELGGIVHGTYQREELPARLKAIRPSFALVASIWPETYCHTLTEAWMADMPVFASDIGTLRERIGAHGGGWLLDHTDPDAFYTGMRRVAGDVADWHLRRAEIDAMPPRTVDAMAADYRALYREVLPMEAPAPA